MHPIVCLYEVGEHIVVWNLKPEVRLYRSGDLQFVKSLSFKL